MIDQQRQPVMLAARHVVCLPTHMACKLQPPNCRDSGPAEISSLCLKPLERKWLNLMTRYFRTQGATFRQLLRHGVLVAVMVPLVFQAALAVDQVTRRSDNVTLRGTFSAMETDSVTITTTGGKTEVISVSDIKGVRFDQEPALLAQAQSNERSGALDSALEKYRQIQQEAGSADKRLAAEIQFLIARTLVKQALADPSRQQEARKAILEFREANKTNFRYLEASLLEASLAAAMNDNAAAQAILTEVKASPVKGFQLQAGVQLGRSLLQAGDAAAALAAFDQVVQQSTGDPGSVTALYDGRLGRAMCLQQQDKIDEAITVLDEILAQASESDTRVLAEAWNRKGDCLRQLNKPKEALYAYLHVDILYSSEPAEHALALYRLSQLWGPTGHQDRAEDATGRLLDKYPNSTWAKQTTTGTTN